MWVPIQKFLWLLLLQLVHCTICFLQVPERHTVNTILLQTGKFRDVEAFGNIRKKPCRRSLKDHTRLSLAEYYSGNRHEPKNWHSQYMRIPVSYCDKAQVVFILDYVQTTICSKLDRIPHMHSCSRDCDGILNSLFGLSWCSTNRFSHIYEVMERALKMK